MFISAISTLHMDNQLAKHCTVNFRLLVMDTSMHTQKPCSGGTIELNHIVYISTTNPLTLSLASVYLSFLSDKQPEIHCTSTTNITHTTSYPYYEYYQNYP